MPKQLMWFKKTPIKTFETSSQIDMHDNISNSECQTDEEPNFAISELSIFAKYLEVLQGIETEDDLELLGFPNVLSVQNILLQQSHQSHMQYTGAEVEESSVLTKKIEQSLPLLNSHFINLKGFKIPSKYEECDAIIQYWLSHLPTSKLKQFFCNDRQKINLKVLLEATQGLMADSEILCCGLVDMKWTFFLEGAHAQATSGALECQQMPIDSIKNLLQDFNKSRINSIEQNKTIIATTNKHQLMLENSISRMSRLSHRVDLILGIQQKRRCSSVPNLPIVHLPRTPKATLQKSYLKYFKDLRMNITPMLAAHSNALQVEKSNGNNNSALVLVPMDILLQAQAAELPILDYFLLLEAFKSGNCN